MNANQIKNRKAAFMIAMKRDNNDLHRAVAPAELMAILHHCDPLHYEKGIDILLDTSEVREDMLMEYMDSNNCWEHDWNSALDSFLMDPAREKLNKIKYEKGLLADDEILAFALFLVGDSGLVNQSENGGEPGYGDTADIVNHVAKRLKFLFMCMNEGRYDLFNTTIQYARREMKTPVDTSFCFDEFEPDDGGVIQYYKYMTDHRMFSNEYDEWKNQPRKMLENERTKIANDGLKIGLQNILNKDDKKEDEEDEEFPTRIIQDEPLVERDFEG